MIYLNEFKYNQYLRSRIYNESDDEEEDDDDYVTKGG